jgi:type IV secretion system protein VirB3
MDPRDVRSLTVRSRNTGLRCEVVFVGATRPSMRWGVTYSALLFNLMFSMEAFLFSRNLLTLAVCLPIHGVSVLLCARDPRFFDLILLWGRTHLAARLSNWRYWRASSVGPLPVELPDRRGQRRHSAVVLRLWSPQELVLCQR